MADDAILEAHPTQIETLWRHYQRQTVYRVIGAAAIQCPDDRPLRDDENVLLYQDVNSGKYYVRRNSEFYDGRFERFENTAKAEPQPPAISPQSQEYLESCLRQFGPSQDGTVERDLAAAKAEPQPDRRASDSVRDKG